MKKTSLIAAICAIAILVAPATSYARDNTATIIGTIAGAAFGSAISGNSYDAATIVPVTTIAGGLIGHAIDEENDDYHRHHHHHVRQPPRHHHAHDRRPQHHRHEPRRNDNRRPPHRGRR